MSRIVEEKLATGEDFHFRFQLVGVLGVVAE
jgi:hypothetical protein